MQPERRNHDLLADSALHLTTDDRFLPVFDTVVSPLKGCRSWLSLSARTRESRPAGWDVLFDGAPVASTVLRPAASSAALAASNARWNGHPSSTARSLVRVADVSTAPTDWPPDAGAIDRSCGGEQQVAADHGDRAAR